MLISDFERLKIDDVVYVSGVQDGQKFTNEIGRVVEISNTFNPDYVRVKFDKWKYYGCDVWNFYRDRVNDFFIEKIGTANVSAKTKFKVGDIVTPNKTFYGVAEPYIARGKIVGYSIDPSYTFAIVEWDRSTPVSTQVDGGYFETSLDLYVEPKKEKVVFERYLVISEDTDEVITDNLRNLDEALQAVENEAEYRSDEALLIVKVIKKYRFENVAKEVGIED